MSGLAFIEGENERYAAPLVFLHGLWAGPEIWRPMAHGFAHRGWRCALADTRDSAREAPGFEAWCEEVLRQLAPLDDAAVLVGHDAGALVALALAERGAVRAAVAVAPLLEGVTGVLDPFTRLRGRLGLGTAEPPSQGHPYREAASEQARAILMEALAAEPAGRPASLRGRAVTPGAAPVPSLLVAQTSDAVVPRPLVEVTANGIEADTLCLPGSHWPMLESQPDAWISPVHRWLIRRLGPALLLLQGDEDLQEDDP